MWSGGDDVNDDGDAVRIYQPILYGRKPTMTDPRLSFVGGSVGDNQSCAICGQIRVLLLQLFVPKSASVPVDRTLQLFACNSSHCWDQIFTSTNDDSDDDDAYQQQTVKFSMGKGVVLCHCRCFNDTEMTAPTTTSLRSPPSTWSNDTSNNNNNNNNNIHGDDDDDWGVSKETDPQQQEDDMDALEQKLAALESKTSSHKAAAKASSSSSTPAITALTDPHALKCFEIRALQEPAARRKHANEYDDDDDDVTMGAGVSDDKIQQMLANYLAQEDDVEILSALQGTSTTITTSGSSSTKLEKDERLSPSDRALRIYTDRLQRSPQQVIRYAHGGIPLWSLPTASSETVTQKSNHKKTKSKHSKPKYYTEPSVDPCPCGSPRVFEVQVLPSLLHVLQVDKYAPKKTTTDNSGGGLEQAFAQGGMNWGNLAIYTCPRACGAECAVIVQDSIDEKPKAQPSRNEDDIVIPEDSKFDDPDDEPDDDDEDMGDESDDMDDCSVEK